MNVIIDGTTLTYVVFALVPNLLVMLWVLSRLSFGLRVLAAKTETLEREVGMTNTGMTDLTREFGQVRAAAVRGSGPIPLPESPEPPAGISRFSPAIGKPPEAPARRGPESGPAGSKT